MILRMLPWRELEPASSTLDLTVARDMAAAVMRAGEGLDAFQLSESIDHKLIAAYGAWAGGWCWSLEEGGVVRSYCCGAHSLLRGDEEQQAASVERVVQGLSEWHSFLWEMKGLFESLRRSTAPLSIAEGVEHAAAALLPPIVKRTDASDAWYAAFAHVLTWYLESAGYDGGLVGGMVQRVVSGVFSSWIAPTEEQGDEVCSALGRGVADAARSPKPDVLSEWRRARGRAFYSAPMARLREPSDEDAHLRFIERHDRARDPARADRMSRALEACRDSARRKEELTLELMETWQAIVLGRPSGLRASDAFAKGGRERYAIEESTHQRFATALAEAGNDEAVSIRAARVYLDVCFYHPFDDGNARAARLALDHVVTSAGLSLHAVEPLFLISRSAIDANGASSLAWLVEYFLASNQLF